VEEAAVGKVDVEGLDVIVTPELVLVDYILEGIDDLHCLAMQSSNIFHIPSSNLKTEIQKSVLAFGKSIIRIILLFSLWIAQSGLVGMSAV